MASARDIYLSYQAAMGTDEVVLPQPFIPLRKKAETPRLEHSENSNLPAHSQKSSGDFFQDVIKSLTEPSIQPRKIEKVNTAVSPTMAPILDFKNLEDYWKFLTVEYPKWFPSSGLDLARAQGTARPVLALVEYAPQPGNPVQVFGGQPGELLEKMMKAIGLERSRLYMTSLLKTAAPSARGWARKDAARMLPYLFRELKLAGAEYVLLLGESTAQAVLKTGSPLLDLRQKISEGEDLTFTASYHPDDLQKDESLKREAWSDLKWLQPRLPKRGME